jgi:murein DD-endopeptidase MepM/ murein hydrolase activator NlpD
MSKVLSRTILLVLCALAAVPTAAGQKKTGSISWQPSRMGHKVNFFRQTGANSWYALAGVPLATKPGIYELRLTRTLRNGRSTEIRAKVRVVKAVYPRITVNVAKQYTEPSPQQLAEISTTKTIKAKVFSEVSNSKLWSGSFVPPVVGPISDIFGTERVFNQEVQSQHQGLDYGVPAGTPVHAVNKGTVVLARALFFEGNCVVIDHGQGLMSLYLHLSEFRANEGETVDTGQLIALSGGTGRATGAHLHLAIRWQGVYLDPAILLKIQVPF